MTIEGWLLIILFVLAVVLVAKPMGAWLYGLMEGRPGVFGFLRPLESGFYKLGGIDPAHDQSWRGYAVAMLVFNAAGLFLLYALQRLQGVLPLNPQEFAAVDPHLAFDTATSFVTNTN